MKCRVEEGDKFCEGWVAFSIYTALKAYHCLGEAFTPKGGLGVFGSGFCCMVEGGRLVGRGLDSFCKALQ